MKTVVEGAAAWEVVLRLLFWSMAPRANPASWGAAFGLRGRRAQRKIEARERVERAYPALTLPKGPAAADAVDAILIGLHTHIQRYGSSVPEELVGTALRADYRRLP
jgi:hypothetical protein